MKIPRLPLLLTGALILPFSLHAADAPAANTGELARSGQASQQEIQGDSRKLVTEIDAMIDEYERNGLKGDELDSLKKLRQTLASMSDQDMAKILDLLQQAGANTGDPKAALKALVDAYSAQKGVLSQLQRIINDYAAQQD
ncbi:MAG TPA: hypothetical protein VG733_14130, partial [Chthoniobacteraceae bacterium]|nr:hypothetical protein [Chthoniobacteraceae bacterium]